MVAKFKIQVQEAQLNLNYLGQTCAKKIIFNLKFKFN